MEHTWLSLPFHFNDRTIIKGSIFATEMPPLKLGASLHTPIPTDIYVHYLAHSLARSTARFHSAKRFSRASVER